MERERLTAVDTITSFTFCAYFDWIGLCSVLRPRQHSIGYMGDGVYRSKDPTISIKLLKENLQRKNQTIQTTKNTYACTI